MVSPVVVASSPFPYFHVPVKLTLATPIFLLYYRENFVCVEPGYVSKFYELPAGEEWVGEMVLKVFE